MPFTTPKVWSVNEVVTAANMNTHLKDNMSWVATDKPRCRALRAGVQSITGSGPEFIGFSDADAFDVGAMHNPASNNTRLTVPSGGDGTYLIGGQGAFAANSTGERRLDLRINGSTTIAQSRGAAITNIMAIQIVTFYALAAGDFVELGAGQTSGGALDSLNWIFWATWIGT